MGSSAAARLERRPSRPAPALPGTPLSIEWLRDARDIDSLGDGWRELEDSVSTRTVLSTFDYNATWYRYYGHAEGNQTLIGVARRGSTLVGVAPLVVRTRRIGRIPLTCVEFAPHEAYAGEFLVEDGRPETIAAFLESLAAHVRADVVCLNDVDLATPRYQALRDAAGRHRFTVESVDHPNAVVDLRGGYDGYFQTRSRNFRHLVRRDARRIEEAGPGSIGGVVLGNGADSWQKTVERMIAITEASHKLNGARLPDIHRGFLTEMARRFAPGGMLVLPVLRIGMRDASFIYGLAERGCFYDLTLSYDEAFAHLRPGNHLTQELLKLLAGAGIHTFVSHGAHDYKQHWASVFTPSPRLFLFAPTVRAAATRFIRFGLAPLWQRFGAPLP